MQVRPGVLKFRSNDSPFTEVRGFGQNQSYLTELRGEPRQLGAVWTIPCGRNGAAQTLLRGVSTSAFSFLLVEPVISGLWGDFAVVTEIMKSAVLGSILYLFDLFHTIPDSKPMRSFSGKIQMVGFQACSFAPPLDS